MSPRPLAVIAAAAVLTLPALTAVSLTPPTATAASTAISTAEASTLNCTARVTAPFSQVQGGASAPVCANDTWIYDIPATDTPATVRRTETHWGTGSSVTRYLEGQTVTHEAVFTGQLGAAAQGDTDWQVIWQLHGPFKNGTWSGPAMGMHVRNGQLRLGGGAGHPNHSWTGANYEWTVALAKWTDSTPIRVKVQTYLSSDTSKGWVSAWVDGKQVLNQWRPVAKSGLRSGTFYPGMDHVVSRDGLYRGTQGGTPPTYRQVMSVSVVRAG